MTTFIIVDPEEAARIREAAEQPQWFTALMQGQMLLMEKRPSLSKAMQKTLTDSYRVMRSRSADERGAYVWFAQDVQRAFEKRIERDTTVKTEVLPHDVPPPPDKMPSAPSDFITPFPAHVEGEDVIDEVLDEA